MIYLSNLRIYLLVILSFTTFAVPSVAQTPNRQTLMSEATFLVGDLKGNSARQGRMCIRILQHSTPMTAQTFQTVCTDRGYSDRLKTVFSLLYQMKTNSQ